MKKIVFITPPDASHGFGLVGVRQRAPAQAALRETLREVTSDPQVGLLIIDERLISIPIQDLLNETERSWDGLVVVLPAPEKPALSEEDYALRLIRKAIGYQVRVNL